MTRADAMRGVARPHALLTLGAVLVSGLAAGRLLSPALYVATALVVVIVFRGARDSADGDARADDVAFLPGTLSSCVRDALERSGDGDAHRLLVGVIAQARPLFMRDRHQLDERAERETRENVSSLVEACCGTAESLAELDRAIGAARPNADASARTAGMRQRLVDQLAGVATALSTLYLAGLEQETDALSRVSQLTADIRNDAAARHVAADELQRVLLGGRADRDH